MDAYAAGVARRRVAAVLGRGDRVAVSRFRCARSRARSGRRRRAVGVFVLAATSNPEGAQVQRAPGSTDGRTVAQAMVDEAAARNAGADRLGSVGVVVGATLTARSRPAGLERPHPDAGSGRAGRNRRRRPTARSGQSEGRGAERVAGGAARGTVRLRACGRLSPARSKGSRSSRTEFLQGAFHPGPRGSRSVRARVRSLTCGSACRDTRNPQDFFPGFSTTPSAAGSDLARSPGSGRRVCPIEDAVTCDLFAVRAGRPAKLAGSSARRVEAPESARTTARIFERHGGGAVRIRRKS